MHLYALAVLALGLSMDATAVSAARGFTIKDLRARDVLTPALIFGAFHGMMPVFGWWIGKKLGPLIEAWDHWVAFALLAAVGIKMLWEAFSLDAHADEKKDTDPNDLRMIFLLAVATSIDAIAVGISLPILKLPIILSASAIALTATVMSVCGFMLGHRFGAAFGPKLDAIGGIALIAIGAKVLVDHLWI